MVVEADQRVETCIGTDLSLRANHTIGSNLHMIADLSARPNNNIRANTHALTKLNPSTNHSARMNTFSNRRLAI